MTSPEYETVRVDYEDGIAWVVLNRPDKRNAMSPTLNREMLRVLDEVEASPEAQVLVLTGAGESFSAGMDLKEFFRDNDDAPAHVRREVFWACTEWQVRRLRTFPKPTIAMVNGWCFGGAFNPLTSCDIAVASEDAKFGLSEINWGIIPGGLVTWDVVHTLTSRDAMFYTLTGRPFDGREAARMGLVNLAVPADRLRDEVVTLAEELKAKNPATLRACKEVVRLVGTMDMDQAENFLHSKMQQMQFADAEEGRRRGMEQFLDDKSYRPGLAAFDRGR